MFGFNKPKRTADDAPSDPVEQENRAGLFSRLRQGLSKTGRGISGGLDELMRGRLSEEELFEELENRLLMADVGVEATREIMGALGVVTAQHRLTDLDRLLAVLHAQMVKLLAPCERPLDVSDAQPYVILVVGVNGAGKTTTIGKLARRLKEGSHGVMLAAGDTYRAAAVEQLQTWGERNQVPVITQGFGADSASVIYDAVQAARARGTDVLIADTAGRLHTQANLMEELKKVKRVIAKLDASAPQEVLLVLDAGTGQNALVQARQFHDALGVTGIAITKLDGTAKGGIVFALARELGIPFRFIGVGEGLEDLRPFEAEAFVSALLGSGLSAED